MLCSRRFSLAAFCWMTFAPSSVSSFAPIHQSVHQRPAATSTTRLRMISPDHFDPSVIDSLVHSHQAVFQSTSQFLADAAETAAARPPPTGWWGDYLNLFKNALSTVHSTIDGPLRSVGVEQTWGIAIFIFTAAIRSLLIPLSIQQSKSSEYMKALRPYISEIRNKFKDNEQAMNQAIGKLYQDAEQNPLAGCLVSLAQLPVFLGLYRGVRLLASDGELQEPFLWIPSLEGPVKPPSYQGLDWLTAGWTPGVDGGLPTPSLGWGMTLAFLVMPAILVVLQTVTMQVLQPPLDENATEEERESLEKTQGFLKFLPLLIGFFSLQVPAGLTIYWFTSNIFTLTQSLAVRAYFAANPPEIELPEYWDTALKEKDFDSMTPEERREASRAGIRVGPTMTDLLDESRFHCLIERRPFREETDAWQRASQSSSSSLPSEMEEWVKGEQQAAPAAAAEAAPTGASA